MRAVVRGLTRSYPNARGRTWADAVVPKCARSYLRASLRYDPAREGTTARGHVRPRSTKYDHTSPGSSGPHRTYRGRTASPPPAPPKATPHRGTRKHRGLRGPPGAAGHPSRRGHRRGARGGQAPRLEPPSRRGHRAADARSRRLRSTSGTRPPFARIPDEPRRPAPVVQPDHHR